MDATERLVGGQHPSYATSLNNLAWLYQFEGRLDKAKPLYRSALEIQQNAIGKEHPDYAKALVNLGLLNLAEKDYVTAELQLREAMLITLAHLKRTFEVQSVRQKLAMLGTLRTNLDAWLSASFYAGVDAAQTYQQVLEWKGIVGSGELRLRTDLEAPGVKERLVQLRDATRRLAAVAYSVPENDVQKHAPNRGLDEWTQTKERLESELSTLSHEFRRERETRELTAEQLRALLPDHTVLIDLLQYMHIAPAEKGEGKLSAQHRLVAFLIRKEKPVERLDLGPLVEVARAIEQWRTKVMTGEPGVEEGGKLRALLWDTLEPTLAGARTVLISPDGIVARLPFAALPGGEPGTYLLEERAIAVIPVPQLLPRLLSGPPIGSDVQPSLMLVGDVDYDGDPGQPARETAVRSAAGRTPDGDSFEFAHGPETDCLYAQPRSPGNIQGFSHPILLVRVPKRVGHGRDVQKPIPSSRPAWDEHFRKW